MQDAENSLMKTGMWRVLWYFRSVIYHSTFLESRLAGEPFSTLLNICLMRSFIAKICTALIFLLTGMTSLNAQPDVVATIRPLQLIAMAVTDGVSEPASLFDQTQDPHHPSLRPSQRRTLDNADILLWVGTELETGLEKVIGEIDARVIAALDINGVTIQVSGNRTDPHVWLDTRNTAAIAVELANVLSEIDGGNSGRYTSNLDEFLKGLDVLENRIREMVSHGDGHAYAIYHNGYQYFEKQFGLEHAASFTNNEEVSPGIRHILSVKSILEENDVNCILAGPSVNTRQLANQLDRKDIQFVDIDILAINAGASKEAYFRFLEDVAVAFNTCLN